MNGALRHTAAFSLVELLVVIAVIAIIAAIAIPNISSISSQATFAKDQRVAQEVANAAQAAIAAGYPRTNFTDLPTTISLLENGVNVAMPGGSPVRIGISPIDGDLETRIAAYVSVTNGEVEYFGGGTNGP